MKRKAPRRYTISIVIMSGKRETRINTKDPKYAIGKIKQVTKEI